MKDFLLDPLLNLKSYKKLMEDIGDGISPISTHGLLEENMGHFLCGLRRHGKKQMLFITYSESRARQIYEDVKSILPDETVRIYPSKDTILYDIDASSSERTNQRLEVLSCLSEGKDMLVIASVESLSDRVLSRDTFKDYSLRIELGSESELDKISEYLVASGYERVTLVEQTGQFSIRGGILDVFPPNEEYPVRVEYFDTEVDSIRTFDPRDQRSVETVERVDVFPVSEIIIPEDSRLDVANGIRIDLDGYRSKQGEGQAYGLALEKFEKYMDTLLSGSHVSNKDLLIPYISDDFKGNLLDYLDQQSIVMLDEPRRLRESYEVYHKEFSERTVDLFETGEVLKSHLKLKISYENLVSHIKKHTVVTSAAFLKQDNDFPPKAINHFTMRTVAIYHGKLDILKDDLERYLYKGYKIIV